jgi:hypothetical protein
MKHGFFLCSSEKISLRFILSWWLKFSSYESSEESESDELLEDELDDPSLSFDKLAAEEL